MCCCVCVQDSDAEANKAILSAAIFGKKPKKAFEGGRQNIGE